MVDQRVLILFRLRASFFQFFHDAHKDAPVGLKKHRLLAKYMVFKVVREGYKFSPAHVEHGNSGVECSAVTGVPELPAL